MLRGKSNIAEKFSALRQQIGNFECLVLAANDGGPNFLNLHAFGSRQSIFAFDTKIANQADHLGMTKQELDSPRVAGLPVEEFLTATPRQRLTRTLP